MRISFLLVDFVQSVVELEDFTTAQPDAIAHSAANIMSRLNAGAEKATQALRSLCWRCKGIQVEVKRFTEKTISSNFIAILQQYRVFLCMDSMSRMKWKMDIMRL